MVVWRASRAAEVGVASAVGATLRAPAVPAARTAAPAANRRRGLMLLMALLLWLDPRGRI